MKRLLVTLLSLCAMMAFTASATAQQPLTMEGKAHNVTVGKTDTVAFTVHLGGSGGVTTATGAFGGVKLVGKFNISGRETSSCAQGHTCILFTGEVDVSDGGWPKGTKTTFVISLDIQPKGKGRSAVGVYHIGPLKGVDHTQYGTLKLKVK